MTATAASVARPDRARAADVLDVAVVVVTHDSATDLPSLLASLTAGLDGVPRWQLVVVDNASHDRTRDLVRALAPSARLVVSPDNAGYAGGVNAGVATARSHRAVLLVNPDVTLHRGCARHLLDALGPGVGITVPRLLDPEGAVAPSRRRAPTVSRALAESVLGGRRAGRLRLGELLTPDETPAGDEVAWATGAVWMLSSECFAAVGGFDESYFLYSEETDFALRARDAGFGLRDVAAARATHRGGASNADPALYALLTVNRVRCYGRRHGRVASLAFRLALLLGEGLRLHRATSRAAARALLGSRAPLPAGYRTLRSGPHRARRCRVVAR